MRNIRYLHPTLAPPAGIEGIEYLDPSEGWIDEDLNAADDETTDAEDENDLGDDEEADNELDVPTTMTVIQQLLHVGDDGKYYIDLIVDVEDVPQVNDYEVRVTKA